MFERDAPYEKRVTTMGGAEIAARGRSAVVLAVWVEALLGAFNVNVPTCA